MKAQFIYENLDFERGVDPKAALELGLITVSSLSGSFQGPRNTQDRAIELITSLERDLRDAYYRHMKIDTRETKKGLYKAWDYYMDDIKKLGWNLIKENLNGMDFERGQDPKESMGIGLENGIFDKWDKLLKEPDIQSITPEKSLNGKWHLVIQPWEERSPRKIYNKVAKYFPGLLNPFYNSKSGKVYIMILPKYVKNFIRVYNKRYPNYKLEESLDFERGKDPKEAIGVGIVAKIINGFKELKNRGYGPFSTFYDDEKATDLYLEIHFGSIKRFANEESMQKTVEKALPGMLEFERARVWKLFFKIKRKYAFYFEQALYQYKHMSESLDFERGRDPKESMEIGIMKVIESLIDEFAKKHFWRKNERDRKHGYLQWYGNLASLELRWNLEDRMPILVMEVPNLKKEFKKSNQVEIIEFIKNGGLEKWFFTEVYESLDFERGKDPYDSLDIGRDRDKRKLIAAAKQYADENIPMHYYPKESYFEEFADTTLSRIGPEFQLEWVLEDIEGWWEEWEEDKGLRVDEAQNFERGVDPKRAMEIGIPLDKILKIEGAKILPSSWEASPVKMAFGRYSEEKLKDFLQDPHEPEPGKKLWFISMDGYAYNSFDFLYDPMTKEYGLNRHKYEYIEYDGKLYPINYVKESLDFERGQDPREAMNIGKHKIPKKGEFFTAWDRFRKEMTTVQAIQDAETGDDFYEEHDLIDGELSYNSVEQPEWWTEAIYPDRGSNFAVNFKGKGWEIDNMPLPEEDDDDKLYPINSVKESLDFERGQDPKTSMGIGIMANIEEDIEKYDRIQDGVQYAKNIEYQFPLGKEIKNLIPERLFGSVGWGNFHLSFHQLTPEEYLPVKKLIDKYYNLLFGTNESLDFERGIDPKKTLGIGLFSKRVFDSPEEGADFLIQYFPQILGVDEIPEDIIEEITRPCPHLTFKKNCPSWYEIETYMMKYISLKDGSNTREITRIVKDRLEDEMGYKRYRSLKDMKAKFVNESLDFERGIDPKESIGIGSSRGGETLFNLIFEDAKHSPNVFVYQQRPRTYGKYDGNWWKDKLGEKVEKEFKIVLKQKVALWARKEVLVYLTESEKVWYYDNEFEKYHELKNIKDFYKYFNKTNLTESLEFERGKDPKESIGIGRTRVLKKIDDWVTPKDSTRDYYNRVEDGDHKGHTIAIYKSIDAHPTHYIPVVLYPGGFNSKRPEIRDGAFHDSPELAWSDAVRMIDLEEHRKEIGYYDNLIPESLDFERGQDPKDSLRIGRKYTETAQVIDIVDGNGKSISHPYDLNTFFGNIEMGLYPGNFYIVLDGNNFYFPSNELKKKGYKKLLFKDKMHILG